MCSRTYIQKNRRGRIDGAIDVEASGEPVARTGRLEPVQRGEGTTTGDLATAAKKITALCVSTDILWMQPCVHVHWRQALRCATARAFSRPCRRRTPSTAAHVAAAAVGVVVALGRQPTNLEVALIRPNSSGA